MNDLEAQRLMLKGAMAEALEAGEIIKVDELADEILALVKRNGRTGSLALALAIIMQAEANQNSVVSDGK